MPDRDSLPPADDAPQFPDAVPTAEHVESARVLRLSELQRAAAWGIGLRLCVIVVEFIAVWYWGYAALLVDAVSSLFDVLSSLVIVVAIRMAARPPDEHYPFGHGRYEPLAGLQLSVLIAVAGVWLAIRQVLGMASSPAEGTVVHWAWLVPAGSAVLVEAAAKIVRRIGEQQKSAALVAEARHYRVDALTSVVAAIGLAIAGWYDPLAHHIDLASAALLAVIMVVLGIRSARENLNQVLDRAPHGEHFEQVRASALRVPGVRDVEKVRIQHAGPDAHVDIDIEVDPQMPVVDAHVITQHVRARIQADWPFVREVVVHVEPYYAGDH